MSVAILDTGALIAVERGAVAITAILRSYDAAGDRIIVPVGCVAQAWRHPSRQALLTRFLRGRTREVRDLTFADARAIGVLLGSTGTKDVVDGHVALLALRYGATVFTSDPDDIRALAPSVAVQRI